MDCGAIRARFGATGNPDGSFTSGNILTKSLSLPAKIALEILWGQDLLFRRRETDAARFCSSTCLPILSLRPAATAHVPITGGLLRFRVGMESRLRAGRQEMWLDDLYIRKKRIVQNLGGDAKALHLGCITGDALDPRSPMQKYHSPREIKYVEPLACS